MKKSTSKVLRNCTRFKLANIYDSRLLNCLFHFGEHGCQLINFDSVSQSLHFNSCYIWINESSILGHPGVILESLGVILKSSWVILVESSWVILESSWVIPKSSWSHLGVILELSCIILESSLIILDHPGVILGHPGVILSHYGVILNLLKINFNFGTHSLTHSLTYR